MKFEDDKTPPFRVVRPDVVSRPVVFNSPHSGRVYPSAFVSSSRLDINKLRSSEDFMVDSLIAKVPEFGCCLMKAHFPRAFVDVNREPFELDPKMFIDPLPDYVRSGTLRVVGGLGTVPRVVAENQPIYSEPMWFREAQVRIEQLYFPFHEALSGLLDDVHGTFGQVVLVDCHSMPARAVRHERKGGRPIDIIIGDMNGRSAARDVVGDLMSLLCDEGLNVARNRPYSGGYITRTYGKPEQGRQALQIEINRALYMNESKLVTTKGFAELRAMLNRVFAAFVKTFDKTPTVNAIAAE